MAWATRSPITSPSARGCRAGRTSGHPCRRTRGPRTDPVDSTDPKDANLLLAERIASAVKEMLDHGSLPVEVDGVWMRRPVTPGDVMILVQRRSTLFSAIIRELKKKELDVAGADRLKLRAELAVRDIEAVLRFLALPEDSLSLACALKSPLFGWDEKRLYRPPPPCRPAGARGRGRDRRLPCPGAHLRDGRGPLAHRLPRMARPGRGGGQ